jgi:hypothetical protein
MFENTLNMMVNVKVKTNDNMKARMNLPLFYHHQSIELVYDRLRVTKSKSQFCLR